jgi:hypothetical protein
MNSTPHLPQQKRRELANDDFDGSEKEVHEHRQWRPFGDTGFVDAYRKVKAHLLVRFRLGNSQEFIGCIQRNWREEALKYNIWESLSRERDESFWDATCQRNFLSWAEGASRIYNAHGQDQTVLVDDVEFMKLPKEPIASLVWLDTVENFESILPYGWYNSVQNGFVVFGRIRDWELRVSSDDWNKAASEVIESAAQAVQNIAKDQRNLGGDNWNFADVIAEFTRLGISLCEGRDRVGFVKPPQSRLELLDVLFGPIQPH